MSGQVTTQLRNEHVAIVEFSRSPNNYFDAALVGSIADAYERLDQEDSASLARRTSGSPLPIPGSAPTSHAWESTTASG